MDAIERREKAIASFKVSTQVRLLAEALPNQAALDTCLLQQPDESKRRTMYEFMKGFLKFPNHRCPSTIEPPRVLVPGQ